jgi:hypothetical protein
MIWLQRGADGAARVAGIRANFVTTQYTPPQVEIYKYRKTRRKRSRRIFLRKQISFLNPGAHKRGYSCHKQWFRVTDILSYWCHVNTLSILVFPRRPFAQLRRTKDGMWWVDQALRAWSTHHMPRSKRRRREQRAAYFPVIEPPISSAEEDQKKDGNRKKPGKPKSGKPKPGQPKPGREGDKGSQEEKEPKTGL